MYYSFINIKIIFFHSVLFSCLLFNTDFAQKRSFFENGRYQNLSGYNRSFPQPQYVLDQLNRYDVNFYKLDLNISNTSTAISGNATIVSTVSSVLDTFYLELDYEMNVDSVFINGIKFQFSRTNSLLIIPIAAQQIGTIITNQTYYHGTVSNYSFTSGSYLGSSYVTTSSEPGGSKYWFPCKQVLDDKADSSEMIITTQATNKAGSNGLLISTTYLPANQVRYVWKSKYPIAYYLISFAVGPYIEYNTYAKIDGLADSILVQNYLIGNSPYLNQYKIAVKKTELALNLYSRLFGVYPFKDEKYGYCVSSASYDGMENQTMTTIGYGDFDTTEGSYLGGIVYTWASVHELSHHWFGDCVTCKTWDDLMVNEGFATYCEYIALQSIENQHNADILINDLKTKVMSGPGGITYGTTYSSSDCGRLVYQKGAMLLHMIRFELGSDSLFYDVMKSYISKYAYRNATGLDFKDVVEERSGRDFTDFFNQWYFGEGYPIFNIQCTQNNDSLSLTSVQTKSISTAPLFKMHFQLRLKYADGDTIIQFYQSQSTETFKIPFNKTLTGITFDPNNWLLAKSTVKITGVQENQLANIKQFTLAQNYPNPFNPNTVISYSIPTACNVKLIVYNTIGQIIKTLESGFKIAGNYSISFNASYLPSGIYFYKLEAGLFSQTNKMMLIK